jgi:phosphoglycerol transferase MdoB-like AlkP superfamily enzyme
VSERTWFIAGAVVFMAAGGGHALAALVDVVRPTFFRPVDRSVIGSMETTTFRFRRMWPWADDVHPSMWRLWLGFNISHGLGVFAFSLLCLPLSYLALSLRFWFYVPAIATGTATVCFTVAAILSG